MVAFKKKELGDLTIGDALRAAREERGESAEDVERITRVGRKYLLAIESNDLKSLPEPIYAKKFVRALAAHYGLDPGAAAESLLREMAASGGPKVPQRPINFIEGRRLTAGPASFKTGLIGLVFLAILGYFAFSVYRIIKPPSLVLYSPHDGQAFPTSRVVLEGLTEPEVDLEINGEPVATNQDGSFKDVLNLPSGVSNLRLTAKKKHSRESLVFMKVVVEEPAVTGSATATP